MKLNKEFLTKFMTEEIAVHCETYQDAVKFCRWMEEQGIERCSSKGYSRSIYWNVFLSQTCYAYSVSEDGGYANTHFFKKLGYKIIKYSDLVKYRVVKNFTLVDILYKKPCMGEYVRLCKELQDKRCTISFIFNDKNWVDFKTLVENTNWLVENEFLTEEKDRFEPFDLSFKIKSKEELDFLWDLVNMSITSPENEDYENMLKNLQYRAAVQVEKEMWRTE